MPPSLEREAGHDTPLPVMDQGEPGEDDGRIPAPITREVEVTRRLFRSGESEYLIDGHHCRLRDIHEPLMDTGLPRPTPSSSRARSG